MTAIKVHVARIKEHMLVLKEAIAAGVEYRPATIGFHTTACAIDLIELYLHKAGKIAIGSQIKHSWFKRPHAGQKIMPLAERNIKVEFPHKKEIIELLYSLEEKRNKLVYGSSPVTEIKETVEIFKKYKNLVKDMLTEQGEEIEDTDL